MNEFLEWLNELVQSLPKGTKETVTFFFKLEVYWG